MLPLASVLPGSGQSHPLHFLSNRFFPDFYGKMLSCGPSSPLKKESFSLCENREKKASDMPVAASMLKCRGRDVFPAPS